MISLPYIFGPPTHLHLILWNRLNPDDHARGMDALKSFMESDWSKQNLPLLRPFGRRKDTYIDYSRNNTFSVTDLVNIDQTRELQTDQGLKTAHCELWIQTRNPSIDKLESSFGDLRSVCFLWEHNNPLWQPLGSGKFDFPYSKSRGGIHDKFLCTLCDDRIAWIMKLIWYRASVEICEQMSRAGGFAPIDPLIEKPAIRDIMNRICSDINLRDYGIVQDSTTIDPTDFDVSHMAAFAVNAITQISNGQMYWLEHYPGNDYRMTRPNCMDNRAQFLQLFD